MTMTIVPACPADRSDIERLLDDAFGADRASRAAYRLREGNSRVGGLSFVVRQADGHLCGSIEFWPIALAAADGTRHPALLLGPIAVDAACRGKGVGTALMQHGLSAADALGHATIVLVGDPEYYHRFGFAGAPAADWIMPGQTEQRRLLARLKAPAPAPAAARLVSAPPLHQPHHHQAGQPQHEAQP